MIDREVLLGPHSPYLVRVTAQRRQPPTDRPGDRLALALLILEDSGELLAADAKAATGQALSRVLNLTDGLIGEGFKTLVLISTNDPLKQMRPAVTREGRQAARVACAKHSREEARQWMRSRGFDEQPDGAMTLAGLYAMAQGRKRADSRSFGFSDVD